MCLSLISGLLGAGASIFNGINQKNAADKAANAQTLAALGQLDLQKQGLDFTKQTYNQSRLDSAPWLQAGKSALMRLRGEMNGNTRFHADPGYKFQVAEGQKGVLNSLSALGMKDSGSALKALTRFRTGLADQSYGQYYSRLADLAGVGQSQANNNATLGSNTSGQVYSALNGMGNTLQDAGAYRASGYTGGANAITGAVNGVTNSISGALGQYDYGHGGLY